MAASQQGSITEFASLNLIQPTTLQTPVFVSTLLSAAQAQSAWSGYPLHFFYSHDNLAQSREEGTGETQRGTGHPQTTTTVYLIAGWESVPAHYEWVASAKNQEIMKFFGDAGMMEAGGLVHLNINFTEMAFDQCNVIVWRKKSVEGSPINVDERGSESDKGRDCGDILDPLVSHGPPATMMGVPQRVEEGLPRTAGRAARVLWSQSGTTIDGPKETYELTAYSDGGLPEFGEDYLVAYKWILDFKS